MTLSTNNIKEKNTQTHFFENTQTFFSHEDKSASHLSNRATYSNSVRRPFEDYFNKVNRKVFNDFFVSIDKSFQRSPEDIFKSLKCSFNEEVFNRDLLDHAEEVYLEYSKEADSKNSNKFSPPSFESFFHLLRYIPEYSGLEKSVYIDEDSGSFGLILKVRKKSKPILNLLMSNNGEVLFSLVKREHGLVKISGRAFFNGNLEDSKEINNLIRMLKF